MAQVEVLSESEDTSCWFFDMQVLDDAGTLRKHRLRLSWADYNLWSADGADSPARVAEAVMQFLFSQTTPSDLAANFDASIARRRHPEADARIPSYIRA